MNWDARFESLACKVFRILRVKGVHTVYMTYSGSGDSGWFDAPSYMNADGERLNHLSDVKVPNVLLYGEDRVTLSLDDALDALCSMWQDKHHRGWENNDGGHGEVTLHVEEGRMENEFNQAYTQYETHDHEYAIDPLVNLSIQLEEVENAPTASR